MACNRGEVGFVIGTERSNAWMDKCRRMWKNCERLVDTSEAIIDICFLRIALRRLGKSRMEC